MSKLEVDDEDGGGRNGQGPVFTAAAAKRLHKSPAPEPTSVLYNRSPSPPTSSSIGGASASSAPELPPISAEDWEAVLSGDMTVPPAARSQDGSLLRWIMDADDEGDAFGLKGPAFDPFLPPPPCQVEEPVLEAFLLPQLPAQPLPAAKDLVPQAAVDELLEAARHADAGDSTGARGILTRLNHRLPSLPPPGHPPLLRAAAHLRDALLRLLLTPAALPPGSVSSPLDVALKLAAHKALADASPTVLFANFTSTQALLDALGGARHVHVVDFDVGFGGHWPPLMQELAHQWRRASAPLPPTTMKVTALVSPGSTYPLELHLTHESLTRFAAELGIAFEFNAVVFDPFDPSPPMGLSAAPGEAVAVHLPIGSGTFSPAPATLRVVKQLRPAIVLCVDHGCHRGDLPLSHHALNVVRSSVAFLESLDAGGASPDAMAKIEQFVLRPRVERLLLGDKLPPWRPMFASAGFAMVQLSNAAEAQAECLLRRTPTPGFHVEKRQAALVLQWQRSELVTVSAWRC
ncbi:scarecrow-like protein 6 [Phragmites australis]|uniref:scarecrow-like protein 6 n=1 Tax=Phragmites australis TaxID=29695 RepID=UPI002D7894BF|nr:scarecrow-like protein 6 [Phragmites australis]